MRVAGLSADPVGVGLKGRLRRGNSLGCPLWPNGFDRIPLQYIYWWRQFNRFLLRCAFRPDARRTMGEDR